MPGVRFVAGGDMTEFFNLSVEGTRREQEYLASQGLNGPLPPAFFLAISGGGDNGAFTAGLLNGWTQQGTRPEFKLVTGISTGALIAPFAFLGAELRRNAEGGLHHDLSERRDQAPQPVRRRLRRRDGRQRATVEVDSQDRDSRTC